VNSFRDIPKSQRSSLPLREWPAADRLSWHLGLTRAIPFTQRVRPVKWQAGYRAECEKDFGVYLRWLRDSEGVSLETSLAERITRENVVKFIRWHRALNYAPTTIAFRVERLHLVMYVMAPDNDWRWFFSVRRALRRAVRESVKFESGLPEVSTLWQLGWTLMKSAGDIEVRYEERRATRFRTGLMIAMLAACPCRIASFMAMSINKNLFKRGPQYRVAFHRDQTKTRRPFESPLPPELTSPIDEYLTRYRPMLMERQGTQEQIETDAVWVSIRHGRLSAQAFRGQLRKLSQEHLKVRMSPHRFRHAAATSIARHDPANAHIIRSVLGHSSSASGREYYDLAGSIAASRFHVKLIESIRKSVRAKDPAAK
jgi:integrase/recombinase XerD